MYGNISLFISENVTFLEFDGLSHSLGWKEHWNVNVVTVQLLYFFFFTRRRGKLRPTLLCCSNMKWRKSGLLYSLRKLYLTFGNWLEKIKRSVWNEVFVKELCKMKRLSSLLKKSSFIKALTSTFWR